MKFNFKTEMDMRNYNGFKPKNLNELNKYIKHCLSCVEDEYGRCVYAMTLAAEAAFNYVAHKEGATGGQAHLAINNLIRRLNNIKGPFVIIAADDLVYHEPFNDFITDPAVLNYLKTALEERVRQNKSKMKEVTTLRRKLHEVNKLLEETSHEQKRF